MTTFKQTAVTSEAGFIGDLTGSVTIASGDTLTLASGSSLVRTITQQITAPAKVGATAGWVVAAGDNLGSMARCPASQSGSTLVVPVTGLPIGATITGIGINAQIESAGQTVTLDMSLRYQTVVAAGFSDAAVSGAAITQVSVTADTAVAATDTFTGVAVAATVGYYLLITATTGSSTDIDVMGVTVTYTTV